MSAPPRPAFGLQPTASLLHEAGLEAEYLQECEQGRQGPSDYYDRLATEPQEPTTP